MAASLVSAKQPTSGLRPMDLRRDLGEVATLIETCFAPTLDAAGHAAIQEMRMVSRAGPLLWVLARAGNLLPGLSQGFVWLEGGRIVGNVSVAPAGQARTYVIANVAVDPAYRRLQSDIRTTTMGLERAQTIGGALRSEAELEERLEEQRRTFETIGAVSRQMPEAAGSGGGGRRR